MQEVANQYNLDTDIASIIHDNPPYLPQKRRKQLEKYGHQRAMDNDENGVITDPNNQN